MNVKDAIETRRAYRAFEPVRITDEIIKEFAVSASLAPSCFNNQPWRFVFARSPEVLGKMREALSPGNEWAGAASMIIAVFAKKELDCVVKEREYFLFDTGMATAFLILRATELGLVVHPIAGYNENRARKILNIPGDMRVITLVMVGKHSMEAGPLLSDKQKEGELKRPERLPFEKFAHIDAYTEAA